jgi:hypothetical protein
MIGLFQMETGRIGRDYEATVWRSYYCVTGRTAGPRYDGRRLTS